MSGDMSAGVIRVGIQAVELCGPGLRNWIQSRSVLAGISPYRSEPVVLEAPVQLSPAERRRAIPTVKLALAVGTAAVAQSGYDPSTLPAVFASSGADGNTIHTILSALARPEKEVSPTQFHNSVHNAPSGYWGVAVQSREAVTSLSGYDGSFAAGLLEAGVQAVFSGQPVLLIAYDVPYPEPLNSVRQITSSFGVAFVLTPAPSRRTLAELHITMSTAATGEARCCTDDGLEALRRGNPAARSLPLLVALATRSAATIRLDFGHSALDVAVVPC
jgi:hypothetical protein